MGRRLITVGNTPDYLIAESSIIRPIAADLQAELDTAAGRAFTVARAVACRSLMGRAAGPAMTAAYPELAAFELAALCVPFTAANKPALARVVPDQRHEDEQPQYASHIRKAAEDRGDHPANHRVPPARSLLLGVLDIEVGSQTCITGADLGALLERPGWEKVLPRVVGQAGLA